MKTSALLAFFFFFLLFAFATTTSAEVVIDSDGDIMRNGGKYYFSPPAPVGGGDVLAAAVRLGDSDSCSLAVVQARYTRGWATVISSPLRAGFIGTNFPLNITFAYLPPNICTDSPDWVVTKLKSVGEPVMVGSAKEFGKAFVNGWFYIKTTDPDKHFYKLVFCEKDKECKDIGVTSDSEKRQRLVVTDKGPLTFKFDKAKESFTSDLSMVV